jgi:uncharacterized protein (TIGR00369 family)
MKAELSDSKFGLIPHDVWRENDGLEIFQKMIAGELPQPPIAKTLGFRLEKIENGLAEFVGKSTTDYYNPLGTTHGGYIATLLDSAMGCAIQSTLEAGKGSTSLEFKVNFVRPVFDKTGTLRAIGEIINAGKQIITAEAKLIDEAGKLYAHATTTCFVFAL